MIKSKFILLLFLFFGFTNLASAQDKLEVGGKIGIQEARFINGGFSDISTKKHHRIRPAFGVFTRYHLGKNFFAEYDMELSFEGGGFKKRKTNLTTFKNTLFLGVSSSRYKKNSFNFKLGFNYNVLLSAKMKDKNLDRNTDVSTYFKTTSTQLPVSIGYVRKINEEITFGVNTYLQFLYKDLSTQNHASYSQTLYRLEFKIAKFIK